MSENVAVTPAPEAGSPPPASAGITGVPGVPELGSIIADRYRLEKLLGEGAMGAVYLAEHVLMRKRFALKVLHPDAVSSPELVARFEREAVAAANIVHPGVAAATDFGRLADGSFFLVLEYVAGKDLRWLISEAALPPARALDITRQLLLALGAAHAKGVVHRDIKPENVMLVAREGASAQASGKDLIKVLDFGIAKVDANSLGEKEGQQLTRMGMVYGTPAYMSPEQAMGEPVDARADLYAVGVMLHEMITGKPPFDGEAIIVIAKQVNEPPPPLISPFGESAVTPELRAFVDSLLAKSREQRPENAIAAVRMLDAAVDSLPFDRAATVFGDTIGVSPRPPGVEMSTNATVTGTAVPPLRRFVAQVDRVLEPLAKKAGQPVRLVRFAVSGLVGLLVLLLLVIALKPSTKRSDEDEEVSSRRHASSLSSNTLPSASASTSASASALAKVAPSATVAPIPSTTTATGEGGGPKTPIKKKSGNSLVNKIKSVFK